MNFPVACCKAKEWDKLLILYTKHGDKRLAAGIFWKVHFNKDLFNVGTNGVKDVCIIKFGGKLCLFITTKSIIYPDCGESKLVAEKRSIYKTSQ